VSLRAQLEAKARRRIVVPIPITDPGDEARRRAEQAQATLTIARTAGVDGDRLHELELAATAAAALLAEHTVPVELLALPAADWEALRNAHLPADEREDLDWTALLPAALAACAADESLQDEDWWRERLADDAWSDGDLLALRRAVINVNQWAPQAYLPKG
jgi:hypothetical protein